MTLPRSAVAGVAFTSVVLLVVVAVQVLTAPDLVRAGVGGVAFLSVWSLGGLLLGAVPLRAPHEATLRSAVVQGIAGLSLVLGVYLTLAHPALGDMPALLGAALLLTSVAARPRPPEPSPSSPTVPAEPAPHLWS